jgi:hypothetical protein
VKDFENQSSSRGGLSCEEALVLVSSELDGELRTRRSDLEAHLAACPACARERSALAQAHGWLRDAFPSDAFGESLARDVVRAIELRNARAPQTAAPPRGILVRFRAAGVVAASAAAVLFVAFALGSLGTGPSVEGGRPASGAPVLMAKAYGKGLRGSGRLLAAGDVVYPGEAVLDAEGPGTLFLGDPARVAAFDPSQADAAEAQLARIDLRPDTAVTFHVERDGGVTVAMARSGVAYFEVPRQERPFRVATPALTATVLGTKFVVESSSEASLVSVVEGRVRIATVSQHVELSPLQEAVVSSSQSTLIARPSSPREHLSWNRRVLAMLPVEATSPNPERGPAVTRTPAGEPQPKPTIDPNLDVPVGPRK